MTNEPVKKVKMAEAVITDEMIAKMRAKIGSKLRIDDEINNEEATWTAIRKFADGIGDANPLWRNAEYAKNTRFGTLVAPPSWIFACYSGLQLGWAGLGGFHNETQCEFFRPVLLGEKVLPECYYLGFDGPKPSSFAERIIVDWKANSYKNQNGELIAKVKWSSIRMERAKAKEKGKYSSIQLPHPWTEDQVRDIEEQVLAEEYRGANVRYWEDVKVGDELKPVVKGPLGLTDEIAFLIGGGAPIPSLSAHGVQLRKYRQHPAWSFRDPVTHALEPIYAVHYNRQAAAAQGGLPNPYDVGFQRQSWQIELLTDWMGDDGFLKKSSAQYRKFVYHSDVVWLKGKVINKYLDENGEPCVDIETTTINQRNEEVMPGTGTVILPSREKKTFPLDKRLPAKKF